MRSDNYEVTLNQELEYTQIYIELMNLRYETRIEYIADVCDEVFSCKVIKLLLQPIAENAIRHGIKAMSGSGYIRITAIPTDSGIRISVHDNGVGMSSEHLEFINKSLASATPPLHLGLYNVNSRVKLCFGDDYGIRLTSAEGEGTTVSIDLPYERVAPAPV
jgi:two-component system sensor histidine kinase YesM